MRTIGILLWGLGVVLGSLGTGRWLLDQWKLPVSLAVSRFMLSLGLGLAAFSYLIFTCTAMHFLSRNLLIVLSCVWPLIGCLNLPWPQAIKWVTTPPAPHNRPTPTKAWLSWALALFIILTAACNLLLVLTPAIDWDGLAYHLALPKIYLQAGGFVFRPDIFHNLFPQFTEMLFLPGLIFPFGIAPKLIHYIFGLLAAGAVYAACRESGLRAGAWLGAAVFYGRYLVHIESGTAFIDLASAAYVALAWLAFLYSRRTTAPFRWLGMLMLFLGIYAATKWHGLALLAIAAMLVLLRIWRLPEISWQTKLQQSCWAMGWGGLPVLPYLARAWILGHNPFWPLAFGIFGGLHWDARIASRVSYLLSNLSAGVHPGWGGLLFLPYDIIFHGDKFGHGGPELRWLLLGGFLSAVAWLLWVNPKKGYFKSKDRWFWAVSFSLATAVFITFWFRTCPGTRYLLPLYPVFAWLVAKMLSEVWGAAGARGKGLVLLAAPMLLLTHPPLHHDSFYQLRTLLGRVTAEEYCAQYLDYYPAYMYLNNHVRPDEKIVLFGANQGFYLDADYLWGNPTEQVYLDYRQADPGKVMSRLRNLGVVWAFYRTDLSHDIGIDPEAARLMAAVFREYGVKQLTQGPVEVYRFLEN